MSFNLSNTWMNDTTYEWYVMPKIRIDSNYAANVAHDSDVVCRIVVTGWYGNIEKEIPLMVSDFKQQGIGTYDGNYRESFYFSSSSDSSYIDIPQNQIHNFADDRNTFNWDFTCLCDIKIYWTGKCDIWLDRVRIENRPAHQYLTLKEQRWIDKVDAEITWANRNYVSQNPIPNYFYFEECQMSHFPMIKTLNNQVRAGSGDQNELVNFLNYDLFKAHIPDCWNVQLTSQQLKEYLYDDFDVRTMVMGAYSLEGWETGENSSYHPSSLSTNDYDVDSGLLSHPASSGYYDTWLQDNSENQLNGTGLIYVFSKMSELSKVGFKMINGLQAHGWHNTGHKLKEPTNQELEFEACLALAYNSKGIMYFAYDSEHKNDTTYSIGITDLPGYIPRTQNVYGQNKFEGLKYLNAKLQKWGPHVLSFDPTETKTCIYRKADERSNFLTTTYFDNIITALQNPNPPCYETDPSTNIETPSQTYVQATTFKKYNEQYTGYFMIQNRRCTPGDDDCSGRRFITIALDSLSSEFAGFNNWKIYDLGNDSLIATFDKRQLNSISLGKYKPGEGKIYKIAPVMQEGGMLVCDEYINTNFTCNGMVYGNGHNIIISPSTFITFSEASGIEMNGGNFQCGQDSTEENTVTLCGKENTNGWNGLLFSNCQNIQIYNTDISEITDSNTAKAIMISNCQNTELRGINFNIENNSGAVQAVYTANRNIPRSLNIRNCTFDMNTSGCDAINITSNASITLPVIIEWCNFYTENENSSALMLTCVTGGAIKNNTFLNFANTIIASISTVDLYGNLILGANNSKGIQCLAGSEVSMGPNSGLYLGGYNYIRNYGTSSSNIYTDNSFFDIDCGNNEFDIDETDYSKHLTGTMIDNGSAYVMAYKNCFHEDSITNIEAVHDVMSDGNMINFLFEPYFCDLTPPQDFVVFDVYGFPDTVYYKSGGEGGGFNPNKTLNIEENIYKSLKDTVNINLRKRNYQTVETNSKLILTQYPDSLESIGMVQKLYMASLNLDSTKIGLTKTYLENLISNNTQNPSLIKRAFYFIQKCKVKLGQYQSALEGFQYIMTQNPYTYEGLVASWDYAATYLLMGTGGSIQGDNEQTGEELNTPAVHY